MERSEELADLMRTLYRAITNGDIDFLDSVLSQDDGALAIGTDPAEWWEGPDVVTNAFRSQVGEMEGRVRLEPGSPKAYVSGDVGWAHDRFAFVSEDGSRPDARITAVFVRRRGSWRTVQSHASIGVPNEEAVGLPLST
jgi:ketosteroid isomerase-like protein